MKVSVIPTNVKPSMNGATASNPVAPPVMIETVDPAKAYEYLETAFHKGTTANRKLRSGRVEEYARQMKEGRWRLNGETIKFDTNGVLRDGQHRLWAIIEADTAVKLEIRRDIDPEAADLLDVGLSRTPTDVLYMHGEPDAATLSSAAMYQYGFEHDSFNKTRSRQHIVVSGVERREMLAQHPGLRDYAGDQTMPRGARRLISRGLRCWLMYNMHLVNDERAELFWEQLISGVGLTEISPIYLLREKLVANMGATTKLADTIIAGLTIKAWGLFLANEQREQLVWRSQEAFPSFNGITEESRRKSNAKQFATTE